MEDVGGDVGGLWTVVSKDTFLMYLDKIQILLQILYLDTIQILFWQLYLDKILTYTDTDTSYIRVDSF